MSAPVPTAGRRALFLAALRDAERRKAEAEAEIPGWRLALDKLDEEDRAAGRPPTARDG